MRSAAHLLRSDGTPTPAQLARSEEEKGTVRKIAKKKSNVGKVYRGETKYIDPDTKKQRNYVVVRDNGKNVSVSKLKSVKREKDPALYEIDYKKYGLTKRTGVDFQTFSKNRMSNQPLSLSDKRVFPEGKERFKFSSHDTHKIIIHTQKRKKPRI